MLVNVGAKREKNTYPAGNVHVRMDRANLLPDCMMWAVQHGATVDDSPPRSERSGP